MWLYTPIHHLSKKVGSKSYYQKFRKIDFLVRKIEFLVRKIEFLVGKIEFLIGKSNFWSEKSNFGSENRIFGRKNLIFGQKIEFLVRKIRSRDFQNFFDFVFLIVFSEFSAIKFETNQIKMTLTENQFLIFFSFSPKLIPFLSSLISNSFFHCLFLFNFSAKFTILVKNYYFLFFRLFL